MKRTIAAVVVATVVAANLISLNVARAEPSSGMLLGVYAFSNWQGLRITGTIPGYSAHGKLFKNDVLLRVTDGVRMFDAKTTWQFEHAKDEIGPFQPAAIEIFRPGIGYEYLWVEFRPVGGVTGYSARSHAAGPQKMEARIMTEAEKPGARALFNKAKPHHRDSAHFPGSKPNHPHSMPHRPQPQFQAQGDAAALFK